MKFVDYRGLAGHFAYMLQNDKHEADVTYVTNDNIKQNGFWVRLFHKMYHSRFKKYLLPLGYRIWYNNLVPDIDNSKSETLCFILSPYVIINYGEKIIDYLRQTYNAYVVLVIGDRIESYPSSFDTHRLLELTDFICTYNPVDAKKFKISLHPGMVYNIDIPDEKPFTERTADVLFIGQEKGRGDEILDIYEKCRRYGMCCDFYIVGETKIEKKEGIHFCGWMSYVEVLDKVKNAKSIINILQPGSSGVTMRDAEAYNLGCFLITSSPNEEVEAVLNDGQMINIENLNQEVANVIKNHKERFPRKNIQFTMDNFYEWIEKSLQA